VAGATGHHVVTWATQVEGDAPLESVTVSVYDIQNGAALATNHHVFSR
jgi:hypothetical protein